MKNKDYTKLSLKELQKEEKTLKKQEIVSAILIGFLFGIIIFGVVKNGIGLVYIVIPILLIAGVYKNTQNIKAKRKQLRDEMGTRKST